MIFLIQLNLCAMGLWMMLSKEDLENRLRACCEDLARDANGVDVPRCYWDALRHLEKAADTMMFARKRERSKEIGD